MRSAIMRQIRTLAVVAAAILLSSCGGEGVKSVKPVIQNAPTSLSDALLNGSDEATLARLLPQFRADLNRPDASGFTPLMQLAATASPALLKQALQLGGDPSQKVTVNDRSFDTVDMVQAVFALQRPASIQQQQQGALTLSGTANAAPSTTPLSPEQAQQLVVKLALLQSYQAEQQLRAADPQHTKLQREFQQWSDTTRQQLAALSQPIATIAEPTLPPVETFAKSPFESVAMFQQRMEQARQRREQQTAKLLADYRQRVEQRNRQVEKTSRELAQLQQQITQRNDDYQQRLAAISADIEQRIAKQQPHFIAKAVATVYGAPWLQALEVDGQPKYDAEKGLMFASLGFSHLEERQEVIFPIAAGRGAEQFYRQLQAGSLIPQVAFERDAAQRLTLAAVTVAQAQHTLSARLGSSELFTTAKPLEVVLQNRSTPEQLAQAEQPLVRFDEQALAQLQLQNPNIKDVQFEAYLQQEQQAFNDDIPQRLAQISAAPIDKRQWLFVIGIERYQNTDNILYSRRSAELFAQVAAKSLGIHPSRQVVLLDDRASSGQIQDQLKLMLSKVEAGDRILFYYSGHGLPVAEEGNTPYLLPADKIPDFVADDPFYRADNLYQRLQSSAAAQVVVFMDSCFTGTTDGKSIFGGTRAATRLQPRRLTLGEGAKMAVLTAGTDKQFSNALPESGHRLFSYYLMKELMNRPASVGDLALQVTAAVDRKSRDLGGLNRQTPVLTGNRQLSLQSSNR
ncbi:hypothetical protein D5085_04115 [Ectothiorhodospiraceae bacterium BW-2]|nr:hypothetical protein D5085_04115 [Ectothiorhodospiraceae bacterium BW-2]